MIAKYAIINNRRMIEGAWKDDDAVRAVPFEEVTVQLDDLCAPEARPPSVK